MNLILISGSPAILLGLDEIVDLSISEHSDVALPDGRIQISAYASDEAIAQIEGRGAGVEVLMDNLALQTRLDELYAIMEANNPVG